MSDFNARIATDWHTTLDRVLVEAATHGPKGVLVFDLDSTVFDNRPRQARIVREYGAAHDIAALTRCHPFHFTSGWDLRSAMVSCGMGAEQANARYNDLKSFWGSRFFTSEYCKDDIEIVGAPRFLQKCVGTRTNVVYVTGRHEEMRAGTVSCLAKCGLPVPGEGVKLLMKPTLREDDDRYKRVAHLVVKELGRIVAAFDNEPTHVNDYAVMFPDAIPVHLATDHSGRDVALNERCISIPHFAY